MGRVGAAQDNIRRLRERTKQYGAVICSVNWKYQRAVMILNNKYLIGYAALKQLWYNPYVVCLWIIPEPVHCLKTCIFTKERTTTDPYE